MNNEKTFLYHFLENMKRTLQNFQKIRKKYFSAEMHKMYLAHKNVLPVEKGLKQHASRGTKYYVIYKLHLERRLTIR